MRYNCRVKTITEVTGNEAEITSLPYEHQDGNEVPTLFRTDVLKNSKTINKVDGKEGELLLTHTDTNETIGELTENGELVITLNDDDTRRYYVEEGILKYDEE